MNFISLEIIVVYGNSGQGWCMTKSAITHAVNHYVLLLLILRRWLVSVLGGSQAFFIKQYHKALSLCKWGWGGEWGITTQNTHHWGVVTHPSSPTHSRKPGHWPFTNVIVLLGLWLECLGDETLYPSCTNKMQPEDLSLWLIVSLIWWYDKDCEVCPSSAHLKQEQKKKKKCL